MNDDERAERYAKAQAHFREQRPDLFWECMHSQECPKVKYAVANAYRQGWNAAVEHFSALVKKQRMSGC